MAAVVLLTILAASTPSLQIISDEQSAELAAQAHQQLSARGRLRLPSPPQVIEPLERPSLEEARRALDAAQQEYLTLNAGAALVTLESVGQQLRPQLYRPEAVELLAKARRLQGLVHLFKQDPTAAAAAFVAASFLEPDYVPREDEWPPEARLAYVDARGKLSTQSPGAVSIRVEPPAAQVYLDGVFVRTGSGTLPAVPPGEHVITAHCPGFTDTGVLLEVAGGGRLDEATLFLSPLPAHVQVAALGASLMQGDPEPQLATLLARMLDVEHVLVITQRAPARPRVRAWDVEGRVRDVALDASLPPALAIAQAMEVLLLGEQHEVPPPPPPAKAWYEHWEVWTIAGTALVVIGGTTAAVIASQQRPPRFTLVVGHER